MKSTALKRLLKSVDPTLHSVVLKAYNLGKSEATAKAREEKFRILDR